jgi:hypothetical protein
MQALTEEEHRRFGFDEQFENRWWRTEVIGWSVMAALVACGIVGVFGRGPLAKAKATSGPVTVEYERVARYQTPTRISIAVNGGPPDMRIFVSRSLLERVQLQTVEPPVLGSQPREDGAVLQFASGSPAGRVTLVAQPGTVGMVSHTITVDGAASIPFQQLVLP